MSGILNVKMLGNFTIELDGKSINDSSNRMRKVWLLLAYLIYSRNYSLTQDNYLSLLQGSDRDDAGDPSSRLKAMFYRARTLLNDVEPSAGHNWIIRKNNTYAWNTKIPLKLDAEEFERLCKEAFSAGDKQTQLLLYKEALALYNGDFLSKLSMESWVMPIATYYHQMYLDAVVHTLFLLEEAQQWSDALAICEKALKIEPYSEDFYQHLMRCRINLGDRSGAVQAYEEMSEVLFSTFSVMPSDESRALYREACREAETPSIPSDTLRDLLQESGEITGALYCEYDFFKLLYQAQARAIYRSGEVIHIALFSLHGQNKKPLARRSLDVAMENLQELFVSSLRKGDIISRCSASQFIIMLPQANYENSCLVCQRLIKSFNRQYPHSPATIHYSVHPLEPSIGKPTARD